jgi:hypothetical protein
MLNQRRSRRLTGWTAGSLRAKMQHRVLSHLSQGSLKVENLSPGVHTPPLETLGQIVRLVGYVVTAVEPKYMGMGPLFCSAKAAQEYRADD